MRFGLAYAATMRRVINTSYPITRRVFVEVVGEVADHWATGTVRDLLTDTDLRLMTAAFADGVLPGAVIGGEVFRIAYVQTPHGSRVEHRVPRPGLEANVAWHLAPLFQEIRSRIVPADRPWTGDALGAWYELAAAPITNRMTAASLLRLTTAATDLVRDARTRH